MQQESLSLIEFMKRFQTEEECRERLFQLRWPKGFVCPRCGHDKFFNIKSRGLYQCHKCNHQASVMANTIFHRSHTPLTKWFTAIFLVAHDKRGISAAKLANDIKVSPPTAWLMLHKIRKAMADRDASHTLSGIVEVDEAYFGAPDEDGKRGRGTDKTPGVMGVQIDKQGRPLFIKIEVVENLRGKTLTEFARRTIEPGTEIRTDGFKSYNALSKQDYEVHAENFDPNGNPEHLLWLHKIVSNLKAFIAGTYHGLDKKHLQRYFDEFAYRFNRRRYAPQLFNRLLLACTATTTVTYNELISDS